MYRLLIVDDEPFITDGLFRYFGNIGHLSLDVYKAYSAEEALDWLNRAKLDIVISDIQMDGMSGLQLLREIHDTWPMCRVIFLSGHHEFEYAYNAIHMGVVSYILKSEGDEAILEAVEKCIEEIEKSTRNRELIVKANEQASRSLPLLRQEYLTGLLQGEKVSPEARQKHFNELQIPLDAQYPLLLIGGRIDHASSGLPPSEKDRALSGVQIAFEEYLGHSTISAAITWERRFLLWMIQPTSKSLHEEAWVWDKTVLFIKGMLETIQSACKQSLGLSLSLILDGKPSGWEEIPDRYFHMKRVITYGAGAEFQMALTDMEFFKSERQILSESHSKQIKIQSYIGKIELLKSYLENGQRNEFFPLLSEMAECLAEYEISEYYLCHELHQSICLMFLSHINRWDLRKALEAEINLGFLFSQKEGADTEQVYDKFIHLGEMIFQMQKSEQKCRMDNLIVSVHRYIHEHLNEDLSLVTLAEKVYLNPAYLSRLYKQITGKNISEYIGEMRMNKAKKLLQKNELKINEIAVQVGYESAAHFSRLFKKATSRTPQEYRDLLKIDNNRLDLDIW